MQDGQKWINDVFQQDGRWLGLSQLLAPHVGENVQGELFICHVINVVVIFVVIMVVVQRMLW